ncbi:hypothetical protein EFE25_10385 [Levilactobacillus brevis]|nr:hypothetical protein [Levilactobacillus brevis]MCT3565267.1 hypothetical protein [Levilactobacillus brevis]
MDCVVTPLKTLMGFSVHLNVQFKFYNLPFTNKSVSPIAICGETLFICEIPLVNYIYFQTTSLLI